ncbi:peptide/nickel transport system substrate-binding protein/oligopeptide transport system substrate-binding protein [Desulfitispora alkaliphila]|uniref:ABC transporter substrate-binding protein n=1 Tax=Desulfitispora alkaliphila TaxID=622674 RepID=UPI003D1AADC4
MKKSNLMHLICIIGLIGILLSGCFGQSEQEGEQTRPMEREGGVFRYHLQSNPVTLDPAKYSQQDASGRQVIHQIYDGLVAYHPETLEVVPAIAEKWNINEDRTVYNFTLKEGVKLHNDKEVTAEIVKASWERLLSSSGDNMNSYLLENIVGADEKKAGRIDYVTGIRVISDYQLEVELKSPNSAFLKALGHPATFPMDIENEGDIPVGAGPFRLVEWQDNKQIVLEKYPDYYGQEPYLDRVEMPIINDLEEALVELEAGRLHYLQEVPLGRVDEVRKHYQLRELIIETDFLATYYLGINLNKEPFDQPGLRQVLNYAIDRELIIEHLKEGVASPLGRVLPPGLTRYARDLRNEYEYKPDEAKRMLDELGYPAGFGLPEISISFNDTGGHGVIAQAVQQQLAQIGITSVLDPMEWEDLVDGAKGRELDVFRMGWLADYPDPDNFLYSNFHSSMAGSGNFTGYSNEEVDNLLDMARTELNQDKRADLYNKAEQKIVAEAPMIWLFSYRSLSMRGDYVHGLEVTPMGTIPLENVWISFDDPDDD